jgi:Protein of unknown function (DUF2804)
VSSPEAPLPPAPSSLQDGEGAPRFGTYQGCLDEVNLRALTGRWQPRAPERLLVHKRWLYGFVATREVAALFAIVDLGYSSSAFAMAVDLGTQRVLADGGVLGLPWQARVNRRVGAGLEADFRHPTLRARASRGQHQRAYQARLRLGGLRARLGLTLSLDAEAAAPALTVIAPVEAGLVNVTQKWAGLPASGELRAGGRRYVLDGGLGGLDTTHGYLARHTAWRWAFACGRLDDGTPLGLNLVEGFNEAREDVNENALWLGDRLLPLGRARFLWNRDDPLDRWHVTTTDGAVDLTFRPIAAHREDRDLVLVRSRFVQPVGTWEGRVRALGREHRLHRVPGVAEDQRATW